MPRPRTGRCHHLGQLREHPWNSCYPLEAYFCGLELDVTLPTNATCRVYMPARSPETVSEGGGGKQ